MEPFVESHLAEIAARCRNTHPPNLNTQPMVVCRYAATVALDFATFAYVAVFAQQVRASSETLSDIGDGRTVPIDYLGVLIVLFFFMVIDRLFYTLGLNLGKVGVTRPGSCSLG